ncbi:MAG: hypothetical protein ACK4ZW_08415 [Blastomonas sp.]
MAKITLHAGDWGKGSGQFSFGALALPKGNWQFEGVPLNQIASVDIATEESVKRVGGTVGWGVAGAVVLGPIGLLAGLLIGGRGKDVTFVAVLKDGRKMLATTDAKTFTRLQAAVF